MFLKETSSLPRKGSIVGYYLCLLDHLFLHCLWLVLIFCRIVLTYIVCIRIMESLCLCNPVLLYVVQDQFQTQSTPRTTFCQEGEDDEDMTPMHITMFGTWYGGVGGQQGCPSQEGGPRLIRFKSQRWRPKATQVRVCLDL